MNRFPSDQMRTSQSFELPYFQLADGTQLKIHVAATISGDARERLLLLRTLRVHRAELTNDVDEADIVLVNPTNDCGRRYIRDWVDVQEKKVLTTSWVQRSIEAGEMLLEDNDWGGCTTRDDGEPIDNSDGEVEEDEEGPKPKRKRNATKPSQAMSGSSGFRPTSTKSSTKNNNSPRPSKTPRRPSDVVSQSQSPNGAADRLITPPNHQLPLNSPLPYQTSFNQPSVVAQNSLASFPQALVPLTPLYNPQPPPPMYNPPQYQPTQTQYLTNGFRTPSQSQHILVQQGDQYTLFDTSINNPIIQDAIKLHNSNRQVDHTVDVPNVAPALTQPPPQSSQVLPVVGSLPTPSTSPLSSRARPVVNFADSSGGIASSSSNRTDTNIWTPTYGDSTPNYTHDSSVVEVAAPIPSADHLDGIFCSDEGKRYKFYVQCGWKKRVDFTRKIKSNGGLIATDFTDSDFTILCQRSNDYIVYFKDALENEKTPLDVDFVHDSVKHSCLLDSSDYELPLPPGVKPKKKATPARPSKKRKSETKLVKGKDRVIRHCQSPSTPPENDRIVLSGGRYLFTDKEKSYVHLYLPKRVRLNPRISINSLSRCLHEKMPHHSALSWNGYLSREFGDKIAELKEQARQQPVPSQVRKQPRATQLDRGTIEISSLIEHDEADLPMQAEESPSIEVVGDPLLQLEEEFQPDFTQSFLVNDENVGACDELTPDEEDDLEFIGNFFAGGHASDDLTDEEVWDLLGVLAVCKSASSWPEFYERHMKIVTARIESQVMEGHVST